MFRKKAIKNHNNEILGNQIVLLPSISPIYYILFSSTIIILIFSYIIFGSYARKIYIKGEVVITPYPI